MGRIGGDAMGDQDGDTNADRRGEYCQFRPLTIPTFRPGQGGGLRRQELTRLLRSDAVKALEGAPGLSGDGGTRVVDIRRDGRDVRGAAEVGEGGQRGEQRLARGRRGR